MWRVRIPASTAVVIARLRDASRRSSSEAAWPALSVSATTSSHWSRLPSMALSEARAFSKSLSNSVSRPASSWFSS